MEVEVKMPDLSTTEAEIVVSKWLVEPGQAVRRGQPLLEVETDKAAMEVEAIASGTLKAIHAKSGDKVAIGQLVAIIEK
ncbi:MAG: hypothetical protein GWO86_03940 [Planctomycetes bacterium]|nr:hypothetical protein [Planctomycetota bacterium]